MLHILHKDTYMHTCIRTKLQNDQKKNAILPGYHRRYGSTVRSEEDEQQQHINRLSGQLLALKRARAAKLPRTLDASFSSCKLAASVDATSTVADIAAATAASTLAEISRYQHSMVTAGVKVDASKATARFSEMSRYHSSPSKQILGMISSLQLKTGMM